MNFNQRVKSYRYHSNKTRSSLRHIVYSNRLASHNELGSHDSLGMVFNCQPNPFGQTNV